MSGSSLALLVSGAIVAMLWLYVSLRRARSDGDFVGSAHPYRQLMPFVMRTRNESVVYFDVAIDAEALDAYVARAREQFGATVSHCVVAALAVALFETPAMNRFVAGQRIYQRRGVHLSFSMKRKRLDESSKIAVVKLAMRPDETFRELCGRVDAKIGVERTDRKTSADREYALFAVLPRPLIALGAALIRWLDYRGLLPSSFIRGDGLYTSAFVANLGSLGMAAGYHHLYEWGNCPVFVMVGRVERRPVVVGDEIVARSVLPLRISYDERIDDGLTARAGLEAIRRVLEHPAEELGCVEGDGRAPRRLGEPSGRPDEPGA